MGKLNNKQRKIVGENVSSAQLMPNKHNLQITTPHTTNGETVKGVLAMAYPEYRYNSGDNWASNVFILGSLWGDWTRFRVMCDDKDKALELLKEIESCIDEYGDAQNAAPQPVDPQQPELYEPDPEQTKKTKSIDTTTYIIIGAAAVVIVLLLMDRKGK